MRSSHVIIHVQSSHLRLSHPLTQSHHFHSTIFTKEGRLIKIGVVCMYCEDLAN